MISAAKASELAKEYKENYINTHSVFLTSMLAHICDDIYDFSKVGLYEITIEKDTYNGRFENTWLNDRILCEELVNILETEGFEVEYILCEKMIISWYL